MWQNLQKTWCNGSSIGQGPGITHCCHPLQIRDCGNKGRHGPCESGRALQTHSRALGKPAVGVALHPAEDAEPHPSTRERTQLERVSADHQARTRSLGRPESNGCVLMKRGNRDRETDKEGETMHVCGSSPHPVRGVLLQQSQKMDTLYTVCLQSSIECQSSIFTHSIQSIKVCEPQLRGSAWH